MIRVNLLRPSFPNTDTCIYFPIWTNNGLNYIWMEVTRGTLSFYSARKVKRIIAFKEN